MTTIDTAPQVELIVSDNVILRPLTEQDAPELSELVLANHDTLFKTGFLAGSALVGQELRDRAVREQQIEEHVLARLSKAGGALHLGIFESGKLAGHPTLRRALGDQANVVFWMDSRRSESIAVNSLRALTQYALSGFANGEVKRVVTSLKSDDAKSIRVFEGAGYREMAGRYLRLRQLVSAAAV